MDIEISAPLSPEKTAQSEVEECAANDDMVSAKRLQDFLRNAKSPSEEDKETL